MAKDQPTHEEKLVALQGKNIGWGYRLVPQPEDGNGWDWIDWINYIGENWFRRALTPRPASDFVKEAPVVKRKLNVTPYEAGNQIMEERRAEAEKVAISGGTYADAITAAIKDLKPS